MLIPVIIKCVGLSWDKMESSSVMKNALNCFFMTVRSLISDKKFLFCAGSINRRFLCVKYIVRFQR